MEVAAPVAEATESALTDTSITPLAPYCKLGIVIAGKSVEVHFHASMLFQIDQQRQQTCALEQNARSYFYARRLFSLRETDK